MTGLNAWKLALQNAQSSSDWLDVDQLAVTIAKCGFANLHEAESAIRLALQRLRGADCLLAEEGDPAETWIEYLLHAVWDAVNKSRKLRTSYYQMPFISHSIGSDNSILAVSKPWCDLLGVNACDVIGRKSVDFLTEESQQRATAEYLPRFWDEGRLERVEYEMVHKNGSCVPVFLSAAAEFGPDGVPLRSVAVISLKK